MKSLFISGKNYAAVIFFGFAALAAWCQRCVKNKAPIKIAATLSLTGSGSHSAGMREAMQLAAEEVNNNGGVSGGKIQLEFYDNQSDPQTAVDIFHRLENRTLPDIYICGLSSITDALAPLAEERHVPLTGIVTSAPQVTKNRQWTFHFYFTAHAKATTAINILNKFNLKELGVIYLKRLAGLLDRILIGRETIGTQLLQGFTVPCSVGNINVAPGSNEINFDLLSRIINYGQIDYRF